MAQLKPLKQVIADEMDRRWKRFLKLNDQYNKHLDGNDDVKKKKKYWELAEAVHDMEPIEHYILEWNPEIRNQWIELKMHYKQQANKESNGK